MLLADQCSANRENQNVYLSNVNEMKKKFDEFTNGYRQYRSRLSQQFLQFLTIDSD